MPTVHLPAALKDYAAGRRRLDVAGGTVQVVLTALGQAHPGVGQRVLDERGALRRTQRTARQTASSSSTPVTRNTVNTVSSRPSSIAPPPRSAGQQEPPP